MPDLLDQLGVSGPVFTNDSDLVSGHATSGREKERKEITGGESLHTSRRGLAWSCAVSSFVPLDLSVSLAIKHRHNCDFETRYYCSGFIFGHQMNAERILEV